MKPLRREDLERVNLLDIAPVRLTESEEVKGRLVVIRPKPQRRGITALLNWLGHLGDAPRQVFLVHGEEEDANSLAEAIAQTHGFEVTVPRYQDRVPLA